MSPRAVVVSPDPQSDAGGTERLCRQLGDLLTRRGFEVTLLGPAPVPRAVARHGGAALWQARSVRRAAGPAQLVVTTGFLGWPGRWSGPRVHVYVGNLLRLIRHQEGRWDWRLRWGAAGGLAEAMAARGATVVAISQQAAEDAARLYRARVDAVLPLGVDTDLFRPRDRAEARRRLGMRAEGRYTLFAGRGEPGKGPDIALAASRAAGFQLLSAGARPIPGSLALGVLPASELAWAYAASDAVVLPTRYEGFGLVVVEAVAAGVPVITTPTGWARELGRAVPETRPLLVAPDPVAVTGALARLDSPEVRLATAAARDYALRHNTMDAFERRWTDLLVDVAAVGLKS